MTMMTKAKAAPRVRDLMSTSMIAAQPSASPRQLARMLLEHRISGVPVIDLQGHVVGVVSKTDLLQWCAKGGLGFGAGNLLESLAESSSGTRPEAVDLGIVSDFMTSNPLTIGPGESLREAARLMAERQVHRLIVVDERGGLQGILTSMDVLKAYASAV
jgi:CBS domain-containing protein